LLAEDLRKIVPAARPGAARFPERFPIRERQAQSSARPKNPVAAALKEARARVFRVAAFSGAINLLTLSGSIYMLQVYDRVLPSRSLATLAGLSVMVAGAYLLQGYLDAARTRMLARIGALFDLALQEPLYETLASLPLKGTGMGAVMQPLRDLELVRTFLSGMGPTAFLDMPWIPVFVLGLFLFHPVIGLVALGGGVLIVAATLFAERHSKQFAKSALDRSAQRASLADATARNAEVIYALGMRACFARRWCRLNEAYIEETTRVRDVEAGLGAYAKVLRYMLQSAILGVGAALVVAEQASGGIMIASSIMMGRALAPIEIVLGTWKQLASARQALERLSLSLPENALPPAPAVTLPRPAKVLSVHDLTVTPPSSGRPVVRNVSFTLAPGAGLALLGASGSGKSSLAKALVGVWPPAHGAVRLDGARLGQWEADVLGQHVGYLPQEAGLFDGTVAENISRFDETAAGEAVVEAALIAGAHGLIVSMPNGYATRIGDGGALLSAGQRQRIGLARALYGSPFLVVLDEPNANLDSEGEAALARAISILRAKNSIVIVISHRPSALQVLDTALVLHQGAVLAFGPTEKVIAGLAAAARAAGQQSRGETAAQAQTSTQEGLPG
jgi:ATP-binding cassette, subfamily C, bacterial PrsD